MMKIVSHLHPDSSMLSEASTSNGAASRAVSHQGDDSIDSSSLDLLQPSMSPRPWRMDAPNRCDQKGGVKPAPRSHR